MTPFLRSYLEPEPTAPGGGKMKWEIEVTPPDDLSTVVWVRLRETIVGEEFEHDPRDVDQLLLDLAAARWLYAQLGEAIAAAEALQRAAKEKEVIAVRVAEDEAQGLFVAYFPNVSGKNLYLVERAGSFARSDPDRTFALQFTMKEWDTVLGPAARTHLRFEKA